jgi:hypothetical protein
LKLINCLILLTLGYEEATPFAEVDYWNKIGEFLYVQEVQNDISHIFQSIFLFRCLVIPFL